MLTFLRGNSTKWLVKTILWTLVLAFVGTIGLVWGYGKEKGVQPVAKVGSYRITQAEYRRHYENMLRRLQELTGSPISREMVKQMNLEHSALDGLIMEKLQLTAAKDAGLEVSDEEIRREIETIATFQRDGHFDRDLYFAALRGSNLVPREYEKLLRQDIMIRKIVKTIADSVQVTDQDVLDSFMQENEQVRVRYYGISPAVFAVEVAKGGEKALEAYFTANASRFMQAEQRAVQLVYADTPQGKEGEAMKKKLFAILNDAAGKDLKTQAKDNGLRYEEQLFVSGKVPIGQPDNEKLVNRVFNVKEGELVGPVLLATSACVLKVVKINPPHAPKLDEVRSDVLAAYLKEEIARRVAEAAEKTVTRLNNGESIAAVAGAGTKVVESKLFKRGEKVEGLLGGAQTVNAAFSLKEKEAARLQIEDGFVVLQVMERKPADMAEYEGKRPAIREALLSRKRQEAVSAWQTAMREEANKNGTVKIEEKAL